MSSAGRRTSMASDVRTVARGFRWGRRPPVPRSTVATRPAPTPSEFPTAWARSPAGRAARDWLQTTAFRPLVWSQTRPTVHGLDRLAGLDEPVVFAANHASHLDAPLVVLSLPRELRRRTLVIAAADYFFDAWWRALGTGLLLGTVPVERHAGGGLAARANAAGDAAAPALLAQGWNLLVFPEGTRSEDGYSGRFRHGAAYLAAGAGAPMVPVSLRGTFAAMPRGRSWPLPGRPPVGVRFGPPLPSVGRSTRELTGDVEAALARLHDEADGDWYGSLRRSAEGTTPAASGPPGAAWRRRFEATRPSAAATPRVWRD